MASAARVAARAPLGGAARRAAPAAGRDPLRCPRDHVRFASQPIEESEDPRDVASRLRLAKADRLLMFSSDYPHYDFDHPWRTLPPGLDREARDRIMWRNAVELYGLPSTRQATPDEAAGGA